MSALNLLYPIPIPEAKTSIEFQDFIPARKKDALLKCSSNRKIFARALSDTETSLVNAESIGVTGAKYLVDLFSLAEICTTPGVKITRVPLLKWSSGIADEKKCGKMDEKAFKNFKDICHFETVMTGLSVASVHLAVAGFSLQYAKETGEVSEQDLTHALSKVKQAAALYQYLVQYNARLNCNAVQMQVPEIHPSMLECFSKYALLCLNQVSLELARKKQPVIKRTLLASIAQQNRIDALGVARSIVQASLASGGAAAPDSATGGGGTASKPAAGGASAAPQIGQQHRILIAVKYHCELYAQIMGVCAPGWMAEEAFEAQDFGTAEGWAKAAAGELEKLRGMKSNDVLGGIRSREMKYWKGKLQEIIDDNSSVYYKPVPDNLPPILARSIASADGLKYEDWQKRSFDIADLQLEIEGEDEYGQPQMRPAREGQDVADFVQEADISREM
ncbi:unnamed protein product [Amoebophrya sp. A25]|nr:unnamed protein product [Amoebophrya sp. A25]|eukprot:GSA25T00010475001.1